MLEMEIISPQGRQPAAAVEQGGQSQDCEAPLQQAKWEDEEFGFQQVRVCVVCFDKEITTVTLPCRHSSLCDDCMQGIRTATNKCPICRARIASVRHGHYETDFVDFAQLAVEAVQNHMKVANAYVYEAMYDQIRTFLLVGLLCAAASGFFFLILDNKVVGIVSGVLALVLGYVPWFTVTVCSFATVDDDNNGQSRTCFMSGEDLRQPHILVAKSLIFVVVLPFAVVIFFAPYAIFAFLLRPCCKYVLPFLAWLLLMMLFGGCCGLCQGISAVVAFLVPPMGWIAHAIWQGTTACLQACCAFLHSAGSRLGALCKSVAGWTYAQVLMPVGSCIQCTVIYISPGIATFFTACIHYTKVLCVATHEYICIPSGHCLCACVNGTKQAVFVFRGAAYNYVLSPTGRCVLSCASSGAWAVSKTAELACQHVLAPMGTGLWQCTSAVCRGLWCCASSSAWAVSKAAELAYQHVLAPMGTGIWQCASAVCQGLLFCASSCAWALSKLAGLTYHYVLAPIGTGISTCVATVCSLLWHCVSSSAQAIAKAAGLFYQHVLTPISKGIVISVCALCSGLWYCASTLAWAGSAAANWLYVSVLKPIGSSVQSLARIICASLPALLQSIATIFTTAGHGVASVCQVVWAVMRDVSQNVTGR